MKSAPRLANATAPAGAETTAEEALALTLAVLSVCSGLKSGCEAGVVSVVLVPVVGCDWEV